MPAGDGTAAHGQIAGIHELGESVVAGAGDDQDGEPGLDAQTAVDGIDPDHSPAEQASSEEHMQVDGGMNEVVVLGGVVEAGQVQGVQASEIQDDRRGGRGQDHRRAAVQEPQEGATGLTGQDAEREGDGRRQGHERRASHAQQEMLGDVDRKDLVVSADRRQDRHGHAQGARGQAGGPADRPPDAPLTKPGQRRAVTRQGEQRQRQRNQFEHKLA